MKLARCPAAQTPGPSASTAWQEPRTLLISVFVIVFAFTEGLGNDWISAAAIDGYHASDALGTLAFAVLTTMTIGCWFAQHCWTDTVQPSSYASPRSSASPESYCSRSPALLGAEPRYPTPGV
jgi:hypothetical protein